MKIVREITPSFIPSIRHDYIIDDGKCFGVRVDDVWNLFKKSLVFSESYRKFIILDEQLPKGLKVETPKGRKVIGSKGDIYYVYNGQCTCTGFKYRGKCKHIE